MADAGGEAPRYLEIGGRRWRASDPSIPAALRSELVHELMDARRAVAAGNRENDDDAVRRARRRVQHAKVALGERGAPWWEETSAVDRALRLRSAVLSLLQHRAGTSTICPSDAARVGGGPAWRADMELAREVAFALQAEELVEVRAAGVPISSSDETGGPLRIARGRAWPRSPD